MRLNIQNTFQMWQTLSLALNLTLLHLQLRTIWLPMDWKFGGGKYLILQHTSFHYRQMFPVHLHAEWRFYLQSEWGAWKWVQRTKLVCSNQTYVLKHKYQSNRFKSPIQSADSGSVRRNNRGWENKTVIPACVDKCKYWGDHIMFIEPRGLHQGRDFCGNECIWSTIDTFMNNTEGALDKKKSRAFIYNFYNTINKIT